MKKLMPLLLLLSQNGLASDCFDLAGRAYRIDPDLLRATSFRESK